jgi:hypothetical protein
MAAVIPLGKAAFELLDKNRDVIHALAIGFQQAVTQLGSTGLFGEAGQLLLERPDASPTVEGADAL